MNLNKQEDKNNLWAKTIEWTKTENNLVNLTVQKKRQFLVENSVVLDSLHCNETTK